MRNIAYRLAVKILVLLLLAVPVLNFNYDYTEALETYNRSLHISDTRISATTQHTLSFDYNSAANTGSIVLEYCSNTPLPALVCTPPSGFDISGAVLSSESGETGFSVHPNTTVNRLVLGRGAATLVTPQPASYLISNVVNNDTGGTSYARLSTHASLDGTGASIDEGGFAISFNDPIDVSTYVPPVLLFCIATSIPTNNCSSAVGSFIDFGEFSPDATSFGTTQMLAATNGVGGYTISTLGTTMTSGNNTIPRLTTPTTSQIGVSQFGMNLRNNNTPNVGSNMSGPGAGGVVSANYNIVDQFRYASGAVVASSPISTDINRYTSSYIVNIDENQRPGLYSTTITYVALATF